MIEEFERHLRGTNLSENTISSYLLPFGNTARSTMVSRKRTYGRIRCG